ncbi:phosphoadenosine phosphosulfate reductase family protein [Salidesulfovibrio onnuriiensis]|uniref:phosphoadenosine phosphosulfate reductase family protein n=1 Tax=Salidesulfovibrio onnuriiensis TaxID=2583823 RepID=UPI0011C6F21D|nr:phosphoadenosine phosphosulfate reductase family protein [Salidesulfovibrio onnuriiensis]
MIALEDKIKAAEDLLLGLLEHDPVTIRVAWTGGKDSTIVLFLWKSVLEHHGLGAPRAITLDTGCKFPEVLAFRDRMALEWSVDLHIARPAVNLETYPVAVDKVTCCLDLKIDPLRQAIRDTGAAFLLTGLRRDEHPDRVGRDYFEPRESPAHTMVNPILDWCETDVWAFNTMFGLPYCELYDRGYRSLGCMPCTEPGSGPSERSGRDREKEKNLAVLTSLGYF